MVRRRTFPLTLFAVPALAGLFGLPVWGQANWKAGVAKTVITPREPIWMAGYGNRNHPSEGVLQDIYAKALALQDETGATTVIVTTDLLGFSRAMSSTVADRVQKQFGVPRSRLALTASHTHSGPVTDDVLRPAYPMPPEQNAVIDRYTAWLLDQVVDTVGRAIKDLAPAQISFEQGLAGFAVNRRRVGHREYPGPVDHDVPVLAVRGSDGNLRAVVFGYACHNTSLGIYQFSGDWAGFAQAAIEKQHPGATALFVAGCGADANPLPRRTIELSQIYGQVMAAAVDLVLNAKMKPIGGPLNAVYEEVDVPFQTPPTRAELQQRLDTARDGAQKRYAQYLLNEIERDGKLPDHHPYPVQVFEFGRRDLNWIILGGEVVADYSLRFKKQYGWDNTWVSAYSNDVFAYIPSLRVWKEGGYEGGGAMVPYGQPAPFRSSVEEIIADKVDEVVKRAQQ